jgi:hypothetical protein
MVTPPKIQRSEKWNFVQGKINVKRSRMTGSQIMGTLKRVEAGMPVSDVCRELGIRKATIYK